MDRNVLEGHHLTGDIGTETNPTFSPDGSLIAFPDEDDRSEDVHVVPAPGGIPTATHEPSRALTAGNLVGGMYL